VSKPCTSFTAHPNRRIPRHAGYCPHPPSNTHLTGRLLEQGVCVSLVDLVTVRQANLYADY